jgi:hypothetical protein
VTQENRIPLDEWHQNVTPLLDRIAWYAYRSKYFAELAKAECERLPLKPEWPSTAQDKLDDATASIAAALKAMVMARRIYRRRPPAA